MPENGGLTDEQLAAIGKITCNSVALEYVMKVWIGALTGLREDSLMALVGSMDFRPLADALANVGRLNTLDDPETWKGLEDALSKASVANDKRNTVVHSYWIATSTGSAIGWKFPRGRPVFYQAQAREMDTPALAAIADEIDEATRRLSHLLVDFWMQQEEEEDRREGRP